MANVMFKKGLLANLPATYKEGTTYFVTDERSIYLDISDTQRIRIGDFQEFDTIEALKANTNPSTSALYYVTGANCLAKWNGTDYIQINLDTGMTSVEVTGSGNAVTGATYNAATRKLTLTMGASYLTGDEVDTKISNKVGEIEGTVKAYVDAKTEGIATDAALGELQDRVSTAEGEIDALQEKMGEKDVATQIDDKIAALNLGDTYESKGEAAKVQTAMDEYKEANDAAVKKVADDLSAEAQTARAAEEANAAAAKAADDKAVAAQGEIDALEEKVGEVAEGKTVVQMIEEAQSAATYDDTQIKADIKENADAIALLNDASTVEGSVDYKVAQAVGAEKSRAEGIESGLESRLAAVEGDYLKAADKTELEGKITANANAIELLTNGVSADDVDGVNDLIQYVKDHGAEVTGMQADIKANADAIEALGALAAKDQVSESDLDSALAEKVNAAAEGNHSHSNKTVIDGITAEKVTDWDDAVAKEHEHPNKTVIDGITAEKVAAWDGAVSKEHEHANAEVLNGITSEKVAAWDAAEQNAKTYAKDYADGLNTAMDDRVKVLEAIDHDAYKAYADQAEADANTYADGLNTAMDNRVKELEGIDHEAYRAADEKVLSDAKGYADGLAANYDEAGAADTAERNAKSYADSLVLTWGSF